MTLTLYVRLTHDLRPVEHNKDFDFHSRKSKVAVQRMCNVSSLFTLCFSLCTSVRNIAHFLRLLSDLTVLFAKFPFLLYESSESPLGPSESQ